jgi:hypothetical protein
MATESNTIQITQADTDALFQRYDNLEADDKLALFYYVYEAIGGSITPAAPGAADTELAAPLVADLFELSETDQLEAMRAVVRGDNTPVSRRYGGLSANNQLLVWYGWAKAMGNRIVGMPSDYDTVGPVKGVLADIKQLEFQAQISLLREAVTQMGYSNVTAPPTQAETGKTDSL